MYYIGYFGLHRAILFPVPEGERERREGSIGDEFR
jgi:hypothetical protein